MDEAGKVRKHRGKWGRPTGSWRMPCGRRWRRKGRCSTSPSRTPSSTSSLRIAAASKSSTNSPARSSASSSTASGSCTSSPRRRIKPPRSPSPLRTPAAPPRATPTTSSRPALTLVGLSLRELPAGPPVDRGAGGQHRLPHAGDAPVLRVRQQRHGAPRAAGPDSRAAHPVTNLIGEALTREATCSAYSAEKRPRAELGGIVPPISLDSILATLLGSRGEEARDVSECERAGFGEEPRSAGRSAEAVERAAEGRGSVAAASRRGHWRSEPGNSGCAAGAGAVAVGVPGRWQAGAEGESVPRRGPPQGEGAPCSQGDPGGQEPGAEADAGARSAGAGAAGPSPRGPDPQRPDPDREAERTLGHGRVAVLDEGGGLVLVLRGRRPLRLGVQRRRRSASSGRSRRSASICTTSKPSRRPER